MIELALPYPPSTNRVWRNVRGRMVLSEASRKYRDAVYRELVRQGAPSLNGTVSLTLRVYPPDRRKRDMDNVLKALLDALTDKTGQRRLLRDDSQVHAIHLYRADPVRGGIIAVFEEQE